MVDLFKKKNGQIIEDSKISTLDHLFDTINSG